MKKIIFHLLIILIMLINIFVIVKALNDLDNDGIQDDIDNCPNDYNPEQEDSDFACILGCDSLPDGIGDVCDNCPLVYNPGQEDFNNDGEGDACEIDLNPPEINISISPLSPSSTDEVDFRITVSDPDGILSISLFVNNENVKTCNISPCDYHGGPYLDGFIYYGFVADNLGNVVQGDAQPAGPLKDSDGDGIADFFDNCPFVSNPDQNDTDTDTDGIPDACDNCPNHFNPDQDDWDSDGQGNECDCNDNFRGDNEFGADCGEICDNPCPLQCIPLLINGNPDNKIDIVFVKDINYTVNTLYFLDDAMRLIEEGMFGSTEFYANRCKFNFYFSLASADYVPRCKEFYVNDGLWYGCPFADSAVIVFDEPGGACSSGSQVFSAPVSNPDTIVHEAGHQHFSLADEYCCGGSYWQNAKHPSVFKTKEECQALSHNPSGCKYLCPPVKCWPSGSEILNCIEWYNSNGYTGQEYKCSCQMFALTYGLDPNPLDPWTLCTSIDANECDEFWKDMYSARGVTDLSKLTVQSPNLCQVGEEFVPCCPNGWWKSDTYSDYMDHGNQFDPDCSSRVNYVFNKLPSCLNPGILSSGKVFVNKFNLKNNKISLLSTKILNSSPPNYLNDVAVFNVSLKSSQGNELKNIIIRDPREFSPEHESLEDFDEFVIYRKDDVNFTLVLPFLNNTRFIEFKYSENNSLVAQFDLSETILDYCQENNYEAEECQISDLDNDGVLDKDDKCPGTTTEQPNQPVIYGCSCLQILELKPGKDEGELKKGCSKGTIRVFTKQIGWARNLFD